jgi:hypothetical protein
MIIFQPNVFFVALAVKFFKEKIEGGDQSYKPFMTITVAASH